jgi:2-dehydro-3-deoxyphosphogluconate aldolase/(4S)-4-hydroxy-2-oxoglutarate aldolase
MVVFICIVYRITEENLRGWFEAGVVCVGMGSKLVRKDLVAAGDFDSIRDATIETLAIIKKIRSEYPIFY